ncbi:MAG: BolA/IbaG family iron-sulfur metabolism protein [Sulfuricellaceae bacterium]|nr:BolA/IbaG family iron-sulfur metabolism protein [Sulfuricellaceae bacterium]
MVTADQIKGYIENSLKCDHIEVLGDDGEHFQAVVVSPEFIGKRVVQQHQLVYQALGRRMESEIHALSFKTFTPDEWRNQAGA